MAPVRVLIVEDETIVALDLKTSLQTLGYEVVGTAASGEAAIEKAAQERPDVVLMDIILKGDMDGVQAAEEIRDRLNIPVIFLTACADDATLQRAKITEPFGYVLKPFEERELHGHIEIALYKHTMEKRLRESEERYSLATQGANDGLWDWNLLTREIYFSPRWKEMLGYREEQIGSKPEEWFSRLHPEDKTQVARKVSDHLRGISPHFESEYRMLDANGCYRWMLCRGLALREMNGETYRMAGSQTDITDRKVYNPLTGLPNRILLMDRLDRSLERSRRTPERTFALLSLHLDGLKVLSDSLGCSSADQLLIQVAHRLQRSLQPQDTAAHLKDDNFVVLLDEVQDASDATLVATRIQRRLEQPLQVADQKVYLSTTVGITLGTKDSSDAEELLRDATTAMHRARSLGKGKCEIFDIDMRSTAIARFKLEADLRSALQQNEFQVYYQPIVCLTTGRLAAFEALVRWQRQAGLALPEDFLPLAESTDLILPLERWVLHQTCRQLMEWQRQFPGNDMLALNVNLSAKHYSQPALVSELGDILGSTGLNPKCLRLEITESVLMEDSPALAETVARIQDLGIQMHMDDFGTGYSSLSYLHRFPISTLKIDRCFVNNLELNHGTRKIVETIVALARHLDMKVIAEGIENLRQMRELQLIGCHYGQGYYFSKPLDSRSARELLACEPSWMEAFDTRASGMMAAGAR